MCYHLLRRRQEDRFEHVATGYQPFEGIVNGTPVKQLRWRAARSQYGTRTRCIPCVVRMSDGHCEKSGVRALPFFGDEEFPIGREQTHQCIALHYSTHQIQRSTKGDR